MFQSKDPWEQSLAEGGQEMRWSRGGGGAVVSCLDFTRHLMGNYPRIFSRGVP